MTKTRAGVSPSDSGSVLTEESSTRASAASPRGLDTALAVIEARIAERIVDERDTRADIVDMNCYGAGYSDAVIETLKEVKPDIARLLKALRLCVEQRDESVREHYREIDFSGEELARDISNANKALAEILGEK